MKLTIDLVANAEEDDEGYDEDSDDDDIPVCSLTLLLLTYFQWCSHNAALAILWPLL